MRVVPAHHPYTLIHTSTLLLHSATALSWPVTKPSLVRSSLRKLRPAWPYWKTDFWQPRREDAMSLRTVWATQQNTVKKNSTWRQDSGFFSHWAKCLKGGNSAFIPKDDKSHDRVKTRQMVLNHPDQLQSLSPTRGTGVIVPTPRTKGTSAPVPLAGSWC